MPILSPFLIKGSLTCTLRQTGFPTLQHPRSSYVKRSDWNSRELFSAFFNFSFSFHFFIFFCLRVCPTAPVPPSYGPRYGHPKQGFQSQNFCESIDRLEGRAPQLGQARGPGAAVTSPYISCKITCYQVGRMGSAVQSKIIYIIFEYSEFGVGQKLSIADLRKPRFSSKSKCRNQFFCKPLSDKMIARNALE